MPADRDGTELKKGDRVAIEGVIEAVTGNCILVRLADPAVQVKAAAGLNLPASGTVAVASHQARKLDAAG